MRKTAFWTILSLLVVLGASLPGCDPYRKLAKSDKIADKDSAAVGYFKLKKYDRAVYLFEELVAIYRGTSRSEEMYFYYSYCRFYLGELVSASYHFEDFAQKYPNSSHAQEFEYMAAKTYQMLADPFFLDQKYTLKAIESYQLFLSRHPYSEHKDKCMAALKELRETLAKKAFEQANLYYKIGYNKAAVAAFQGMINKFPDSDLRESAQYYLFRAAAKLAAESIDSKRSERYDEAIDASEKFEEKFPDSKFAKDAAGLKESLLKGKAEFEESQARKAQAGFLSSIKEALTAAENTKDPEIRNAEKAKADRLLMDLRANHPESKALAQAEKLFDTFDSKKDEK